MEDLTTLYCSVDDFWKTFKPEGKAVWKKSSTQVIRAHQSPLPYSISFDKSGITAISGSICALNTCWIASNVDPVAEKQVVHAP